MKLYTNTPLISRKQKIGFWSTLVGVGMMVGAIFLSQNLENVVLAWFLSLLGLSTAFFGTYHINRWGRRPFSHVAVAQPLEKLDSRYLLANHFGVVPHLLLTPKGVVGIRAKRYEGPVQYNAATQKWQGKFSLPRMYMQGMTAEGLGNPTADAEATTASLQAWLTANQIDAPVTTVIYFVSPKVTLSGDPTPVPIALPDTLRKIVQEQFADTPNLPHDTAERLRQLIEERAEKQGLNAATPEKRAKVRVKSRRKVS